MPGVVPPWPVALGGPGRPTEPGRTAGRRPVHGNTPHGWDRAWESGLEPSRAELPVQGWAVCLRPARTCPLCEPPSAPFPREPAASAQTSAPACAWGTRPCRACAVILGRLRGPFPILQTDTNGPPVKWVQQLKSWRRGGRRAWRPQLMCFQH